MIKKITRLLEIGEKTRPEDKVYCDGHLLSVKCLSLVTKESNPIQRETNVIELPEIPEGFRQLTIEDKKKSLEGKIMVLSDNENGAYFWAESKAGNANCFSKSSICIIKPKQKGFTIQDVKSGMTFFLGNIPYKVNSVQANQLIVLENFGWVTIETINKHLGCLNSDGVITPCSEYKG